MDLLTVDPLNTLFFCELKTWNYMLNYTEYPEANSFSRSYSLTTKFGMKFGEEGIAFEVRVLWITLLEEI